MPPVNILLYFLPPFAVTHKLFVKLPPLFYRYVSPPLLVFLSAPNNLYSRVEIPPCNFFHPPRGLFLNTPPFGGAPPSSVFIPPWRVSFLPLTLRPTLFFGNYPSVSKIFPPCPNCVNSPRTPGFNQADFWTFHSQFPTQQFPLFAQTSFLHPT